MHTSFARLAHAGRADVPALYAQPETSRYGDIRWRSPVALLVGLVAGWVVAYGSASLFQGRRLVDVSESRDWDDEAVMEFFATSTRNQLAAERAVGVGPRPSPHRAPRPSSCRRPWLTRPAPNHVLARPTAGPRGSRSARFPRRPRSS